MLNYQLIRQKRKTIGIRIDNFAKITVTAPKSVPQRSIDEFLRQKSKWIADKTAIIQQKMQKFADIYGGQAVFYHGNRYKIDFDDTKLALVGETESFTKKLAKNCKNTQKMHVLTAFLRKNAKDYLHKRTQIIKNILELHCHSTLKICNFRSKWGCCNQNKEIRLNWRLIMLPHTLSDYVIVHELCHIKYLNHSKDFWREVQSVIPNYKQLKLQLAEFSFLNEIY